MLPTEISNKKVKELLDSQADLLLVDCRQPEEYEICRIEGAVPIPMNETPQRIEELRAAGDKPIVVYCHHGVRSLKVVDWLREQGLANSQSMTGGIGAWSQDIDPAMPTY